MSLQGKVNLRFDFENTAVQDSGSRSAKITKASLLAFLDGTGLGQVQKVYADDVSVIQSVNTDVDLAGVLTDQFGVALTFTAIKGVLVVAGSANPGNLTVGNVTNGITSPFGAATHSQIVAPGGWYGNFNPSAAGFTVTAATADLLRIASAATAGTYTFSVYVVGI